MTATSERAAARSRTPAAAGRRASTDPVTAWALADRDREREAYRALYEALYPPPGDAERAS